jgi:diguanylate cyclase (GGDEF)-like protein
MFKIRNLLLPSSETFKYIQNLQYAMEGLEGIIASDRRKGLGRRRSDNLESLPGHDSYAFIQEYVNSNNDANTGLIPVEHLQGLVHYVQALQQHALKESHSARHDALTRLPNTFGLGEELAAMCKEADQNNTNLTYIFFDIDNFKRINTEYTHAGGDKILSHLGAAILKFTRPQDYAGRVGGEEFAVAIKDTSLDEGLAVAKRLKTDVQEAMDSYFSKGEIPTSITVSMGVSNYTGNSSNVHELQQRAKEALMHAKGIDGKNSIMYISPQGNPTEYAP